MHAQNTKTYEKHQIKAAQEPKQDRLKQNRTQIKTEPKIIISTDNKTETTKIQPD